ncbi:hypothetical protein LLG39_07695 [bacterium]|nr:hypothetical protein [bacterium]
MKLHRRLSLLVLLVSTITAPIAVSAATTALPGVEKNDAAQFMPVSQLKRGMRGYGLTVFQGTKIEKFDVEILGVLKQMNTGKDLILVRIGGGPINKRETTIIAGMSGSPCYINGKMIGAISYGRGFSKEPVGMITPIADMLEAWDGNLPKQASGYSTQTLVQPMTVNGKTVKKVAIDKPGENNPAIENGVLHMQPLMTPMMVSGMSARGLERLSEILEPFHIKPMAGPGGGGRAAENAKASLVPGAAIGMSLASGDIDMTGIGTVTYRRGNKIVAFGHPMLGIGAIDAPMTTAYVEDVLSSYEVSSKMASPIKTVGRIFQDRPWSIAGAIGNFPATIPVKITIDDDSTKRGRTYNVKVINHPLLASRLVTTIVGEAIFDLHCTPGDSTAEVSYDVNADQIGQIKRSNVFFDPVSIDSAAVADIGTLLQTLSSNKFYPVDVKAVNVHVKILDKRNTATIDRIFVKKSEYQPGETVDVGVVLRPYKKDRITKTYKIKIPATAADGKVTLQVRGGGSASAAAMLMPTPMPGDDMTMGSDNPAANVDNVKQLVNKYLEREKNNQIVVQLLMRSTAINVAGEKLSGLPSTVADVMKSSRNSGLKMERDEVKELYTDDMIVTGAARLSIDVKQKRLNESKTSATAAPAASAVDIPDTSAPALDDSNAVSVDDSIMLSTSGKGPGVAVSEAPADDDEGDVDMEPVVEEPAEQTVAKAPEGAAAATTAATPDSKVGTGVKSVVRQAKTWTQSNQSNFANGTFSGVSASSKNKLEMVPTLQKLVETPEQFVWCVAPAKDGVYAGTGNSGKIYHVTESGDMKVLYETGELEVHALAVDSSGNIYAGTSPHGKIFKITPDGKGKLLYTTEERYVMALATDDSGNVYAGVGDSGKIYKIPATGEAAVLTDVNEQQILSLHWDSKIGLVAGTGIKGVVYKVTPSGRTEPVFDAPESAIASIATDNKGNIYAGTSPKGVIYKIGADARSKTIFSKADRVLSMTTDAAGNVYAVSDGTLVKIAPDETVIQLDSSQDKVQFLSTVYNEHTGALYASTGNIGSIYISKCCDVAGNYESPVHDAKMISKWGRIKWVAEVPEGTKVELQTRSGNVETPDSTWSEWSAAYTNSAGEQIVGTNARYIQYKVTLRTAKPDVSPKVASVTLSYMTPNQAPTVKLTSPLAGVVWSGNNTIKWAGTDPDSDTLTYDVFYSVDGGKAWQTLVGGMKGTQSADEKAEASKKIVDKVKSELEKSPDVPSDMKKKVLDGHKTDAEPGKPAAPATDSSTKSSYAWDTSKVQDGTYVLKVVASDRNSNAADPQTGEAISDPFVICNTPPKLVVYKNSIEIKDGAPAVITGSATSKLVEIAGVQYRVNGGSWIAAAPEDGVFDSPYESFAITADGIVRGTSKIEIQAVDSAGNASTQTVEVKAG